MLKQSHALFPVVLEVDEDESRCFNFNVGSNADVHLIMLPLPHETQIDNHDLVESWYVQQVYKMLRQKLDSDDRNGATSDSSSSTGGAPIPLQIVSHNRIPASIEKAIAVMEKYGIDRSKNTVYFGQLYGMSDHLSFNLGRSGYRAYKYVPYGEVQEVIPYLLRRARENSSISSGAAAEFDMIKEEMKRRLNPLGPG